MGRKKQSKRNPPPKSKRAVIPPPPQVRGKDARTLFDKVALDTLHGYRDVFDGLNEHEQKVVLEWFADAIVDGKPENAISEILWEVDFDRKPVGIEKFITDPYYFGKHCAQLSTKWMDDFIKVFRPGSPIFLWLMTGGIGIGKGQPVDGHVATPDGWVRVGDIRVGDAVIGSAGRATRVTGVYPRGRLPVYRVTFSDGASLVVDGDHLWAVQTPKDRHRGRGYSVMSTRDMQASTLKNKRGQRKWHIPVLSAPVQYAPVKLPVEAYSFGKSLGVCVHSHEKFVPREYLYGSVHDRTRLLQGLMDADGRVRNSGKSALFCSTSEQLARDVIHLVQSLGGVATIRKKKMKSRDAYVVDMNVTFNPFLLSRKASMWRPCTKNTPRRMVDSIIPCGESDVVCISVDSDDSLYVADNFIVTHNTTAAVVGLAYKLHWLGCLKDPAKYYGLLPDSRLAFGLYSITKSVMADTGFYKLRTWLDGSPFFRTDFKRNPNLSSRLDFKPTSGKNIVVVGGSRDTHALSQDLFSFAIDEVNFMKEKEDSVRGEMIGQAYDLYEQTYTRLESRFMRAGGTIPGMIFIMSSRTAQTSFLEGLIKAHQNKPYVHVSDYALWDIKPNRFRMPKFRVEVGDRITQSRILDDDEVAREGARVLDVPGELKPRFREALDASIRNLAGVATYGISPLIRDRKSVFDAVRENLTHPFTKPFITMSYDDDVLLEEYFQMDVACHIHAGRWTPRLNPLHPRAIHVDLSKNGCATGIAMGHVSGMVTTNRVNADGSVSKVVNPFIVVDFMLKVVAASGGEISPAKIRAFILYLRSLYPIFKVTYDGFQSMDSVQILRNQEIDAGLLSMDKKEEPYLSLRSSHFDRRIAMYRYEPYINEVLDLERDIKRRKIDHPVKATSGGEGSKDVSDCVAGIVWTLISDDRATQEVPVFDSEVEKRKNDAISAQDAASPPPPQVRVGGKKFDWDQLNSNMEQRS